jgi:uncharacterized damage-inducible protein DinB
MSSWVREAIIDRIHGMHIHIDPIIALDGLDSDNATYIPFKEGRSPIELLFHIVFWLEFSLSLMSGEIKEYTKGADWDLKHTNWNELVDRFCKSLSRLEFIAENWDLDEVVWINDELSTYIGAEILGVIQHTSYHIGQIVMARRALNLWSRN